VPELGIQSTGFFFVSLRLESYILDTKNKLNETLLEWVHSNDAFIRLFLEDEQLNDNQSSVIWYIDSFC
jgi:hypothetical protein